MMMNFNVFSTRMKNRVLWNIYNTKVITMYAHGLLLNSKVFKYLLHPQELRTIVLNNNILSFGNR